MTTLISLLILVAIIVIAFWIIDAVPTPAPFNLILKLIIGLFALIKLFAMLGVH